MATIIRPPLVSQQQPKRPIASVDYFSRPLTLGINPNASIAQLSDSAPQRTRRIHVDLYPNLLGTTLASGAPATLDLPLRAGRTFESAPRKRWQADAQGSQGFIVYDGPEAAVLQLSESAPRARRALAVEQPTNLLANTLAQSGLGLPLLAIRLDASAARRGASLSIDAQGSRLLLGDITMPLMADRVDASAPGQRRQIALEHLGSSLTLGINPNAAVVQLSDSAPPLKRAGYAFDPPNIALAITPPDLLSLPLSAARVDASAPALKYHVKVESLFRPLALGINPNAIVAQLTDSATVRGKAAYGFDGPNLLLGTLAESIALPLTAGRVDASAPILKYQVRVESLSRPVTIGINPNPLIAQLTNSAPPPKKAAYAFDPPNLIGNTLAEPLELPRLSVRMDWSAPQTKRSAYLDTPSNSIVVNPAPSRTTPPRAHRIVVASHIVRRVKIRAN